MYFEGQTQASLPPISAGRGHQQVSGRSQHSKQSDQIKIKPLLLFFFLKGELANLKGKRMNLNNNAVARDTRSANDLPLTVNIGWLGQQPWCSFIPITSPYMSRGGNYY